MIEDTSVMAGDFCMLRNKYAFLACLYTLVYITTAQTDPSNLACSAINSTAIQVTWTQATDASVLGYHIDVERVDGLRIEPDIPTKDMNSKTYDSYDVNGLGNYGTYGITIHSYTSSGNLTDYNINCTTDEDVPDYTSLNFQCVGTTVSAITCTWDDMAHQVYWNGIPVGWRIQYLRRNMSDMYEVTVGSATLSTVVTGLQFDTTYVLLLNAYTSVGQGTMYTTATATTLGGNTPTEESVRRYYCYEAVPGWIEFGWSEMPCTIYSGTIGGLFALVLLLISIFACQACCSKAGGGSMELNIHNEFNDRDKRRRDNYSDDEDDDDISDENDDNERNEKESEGDESDQESIDPEDGHVTKTPSPDDDEFDGRDTRESVTSPNTPAEENGGIGGRQQSGVSLDGALSSRQVRLDDADTDSQAVSDSDYDSQTDDDGEFFDSVPPLPTALQKQAKTTSTEITNVISRPGTTATKQKKGTTVSPNPTAKAATTSTKVISSTGNKRQTSTRYRERKVPSVNAVSVDDVKKTSTVLVTTAAIHHDGNSKNKPNTTKNKASKGHTTTESLWGDDDDETSLGHKEQIADFQISHMENIDAKVQVHDYYSSVSATPGEWDDPTEDSVATQMSNSGIPVKTEANLKPVTTTTANNKHGFVKYPDTKGQTNKRNTTSDWDDELTQNPNNKASFVKQSGNKQETNKRNTTSDWDDELTQNPNNKASFVKQSGNTQKTNKRHTTSDWDDELTQNPNNKASFVKQSGNKQETNKRNTTSDWDDELTQNPNNKASFVKQSGNRQETNKRNIISDWDDEHTQNGNNKYVQQPGNEQETNKRSTISNVQQGGVVGDAKQQWNVEKSQGRKQNNRNNINTTGNNINTTGNNINTTGNSINTTGNSINTTGNIINKTGNNPYKNETLSVENPPGQLALSKNTSDWGDEDGDTFDYNAASRNNKPEITHRDKQNDVTSSRRHSDSSVRNQHVNVSNNANLNRAQNPNVFDGLSNTAVNPGVFSSNANQMKPSVAAGKTLLKTSHSVPVNLTDLGSITSSSNIKGVQKTTPHRVLVSRGGSIPNSGSGPDKNVNGVPSVVIEMADLQDNVRTQYEQQAKQPDTDVDMLLLPNDSKLRVSDGSRIVTRPERTPRAWATNSRDKPLGGRRTPVKELNLTRDWTTIDIEPVMETDRLGKKFPFLNVSKTTNTSKENNLSDNKHKKTGNSHKKNVSNNAAAFLSALNSTKADGSEDKSGKNKGQIFYGFGVGRFRKYATAWLSKVRAKKNPVITAPSVWN